MDKSNGKVLEESHCELHLLQHCAPQEAIGVAERFDNLKVVVPLADQYLYRLAVRLHGCCKLTRLTYELRALKCAIGDDHRGVIVVQIALRTQHLLHLVREVDVFAAARQTHRFKVEQAATVRTASVNFADI